MGAFSRYFFFLGNSTPWSLFFSAVFICLSSFFRSSAGGSSSGLIPRSLSMDRTLLLFWMCSSVMGRSPCKSFCFTLWLVISVAKFLAAMVTVVVAMVVAVLAVAAAAVVVWLCHRARRSRQAQGQQGDQHQFPGKQGFAQFVAHANSPVGTPHQAG